jgi:CheY-like chemotaxis protein
MREHHLAQRNIALLLELHPGVMAVLVNREEIQQVVLNLVMNAEHAIGDRPGTITIRTNAGENAHFLQVTDDGPGVGPELRGRVFEPFFTTKEVGEGTGLGLSIALGIANAHGGALSLVDPPAGDRREPASGVGPASDGRKGACFQLTLPAHAIVTPSARRDADARETSSSSRGSRRVLVVEDEETIRARLVRLLERRDYDVIDAASCADARRLSEGVVFDLVMCDVRLGDGNGGDLLRHLLDAQPELERHAVFVTGDIGALADQANEFGHIPVLVKPFTAMDLDRVLADVEVSV